MKVSVRAWHGYLKRDGQIIQSHFGTDPDEIMKLLHLDVYNDMQPLFSAQNRKELFPQWELPKYSFFITDVFLETEIFDPSIRFPCVYITSWGTNKINVITEVRELTGLGLKAAKDLVESASERHGAVIPKYDDLYHVRDRLLRAGVPHHHIHTAYSSADIPL